MKDLIRQQLIQRVEKEIIELQKEIDKAKEVIEDQAAENYDSRNASLIPSTTARNILKIEETKRQLEELRNFKVNGNNSISLGSLVTVNFKSPTGKSGLNTFFVLKNFGGESIIVDDKKFSIISTSSDFFKNAKGKVIGDIFDMKISTAEIIKIE